MVILNIENAPETTILELKEIFVLAAECLHELTMAPYKTCRRMYQLITCDYFVQVSFPHSQLSRKNLDLGI